MSICEGFPTFRGLTLSPFLGYAGGLVERKLISFGSAKPPANPDEGGKIISRNVGKSRLDASAQKISMNSVAAKIQENRAQ
jgi:hypothetical protein